MCLHYYTNLTLYLDIGTDIILHLIAKLKNIISNYKVNNEAFHSLLYSYSFRCLFHLTNISIYIYIWVL